MTTEVRLFHKVVLTIVLCSGCHKVTAADAPWPPPTGVPLTRWAKDVSPTNPLPDYPRPQLTRDRWQNLNGLWDFAIVEKDSALPSAFDQKILVPFAPQSVLSRVNKPISPASRIWYHRPFQVPAAWAGQRVLLHFGAVNWETHVLVNGKEVGAHSGGYDGFSFDITSALVDDGPQQLLVSAWNPVEGGQPRGKQALKPAGIFYTPTTGIWQTVWIEPVPASHIESLRIVPDVDGSRLKVEVSVAGALPGETVEAVVLADGKVVATKTALLSDSHRVEDPERAANDNSPGIAGRGGSPPHLLSKSGGRGAPPPELGGRGAPPPELGGMWAVANASFAIPIPHPRLWWPESPFLYDLKITLKERSKTVDSVGSYFGMRKISVGPDGKGVTRMLLNNRFIFENGFLDQGFWPDGVYTAPTDVALRSDIEATRKLGFNMTRKHVKVEPDRWYYWADKLGLLVWQDMPASIEMDWGSRKEFIPDREGEFELELRRMVEGKFNHPSIIVWVVFNEGWGLGTVPRKPGDKQEMISEASKVRQQRMVATVRQEDPTRLIDPESGAGGGGNQGANFWDIGLGDIVDYHCYGGDGPHAEAHRASVIGETGWGVAPGASLEGRLKTTEALGLSAIVFTQLTDVENERNGALNYDRTPKPNVPLETTGADIIAKLHAAGYTNYPGGPEKP